MLWLQCAVGLHQRYGRQTDRLDSNTALALRASRGKNERPAPVAPFWQRLCGGSMYASSLKFPAYFRTLSPSLSVYVCVSVCVCALSTELFYSARPKRDRMRQSADFSAVKSRD